MAQLAFEVRAKYDEAIRLTQKLKDLEDQMKATDASTEKGKAAMEKLSTQYRNTEKDLQKIAGEAAKAAYYMGGEFKKKVADAGKEVENLSNQLKHANDRFAYIKKNGEAYSGQLDEAKGQVASLTKQLVPAQQRYSELSNTLEKYNGTAEKNSGIMVKMLGGQEKYNAILSVLPGPIKNVITGINGITKASLKFIATPVGAVIAAIVLALQALMKWFTSSAEGQEKFAEISGYVKGVLDQLGETVLRVGKGIYDFFANIGENAKKGWQAIKQNFVNHIIGFGRILPSIGKMVQDVVSGNFGDLKDDFKGFRNNVEMMLTGVDDLEGKWTKATDAVGNYIQNTKNAAKEQASINKERFNLDRQYSDWQVKRSQQDARKNELRTTMYDTNLSASQRRKALDEYKGILSEQQKMETEFADKRIELQERAMALTTNPVEEEKKLNELKAEKNRIVAQTNMELAMLQRRGNSIINSGKSQSDNAIKQRQKYEDVLRQQNREDIQLAKEHQFSLTQARIDAMEEGSVKTLAQMDLDHEKELNKLDQQYEALRDEKIKKAKELYEANPDNYDINHRLKTPFQYSYNSALFDPTDEEKKVYEAQVSAENKKYTEAVKQYYKTILDTAEDYGSRVTRVNEKYDKEQAAIKRRSGELTAKYLKATTEAERKAIEDEMELNAKALNQSEENRRKAIRSIEKDFSVMYAFIFQDVTAFTNSQLDKALQYVQEAISDAKGDVQELQTLYARMEAIQKEQRGRRAGWGLNSIRGGFGSISASGSLYDEARKAEAEKDTARAQSLLRQAFALMQEGQSQITKGVQDYATVFGELGDILSSFDADVSGTFKALKGIGDLLKGLVGGASSLAELVSQVKYNVDETGKIVSAEISKGAAVTSVISGSLELLSMVGETIRKNKAAEEDWNRTIERSADKLASLKIEELSYKESNIFGVESPYSKAISGAAKYAASMEELIGLQNRLNAGQVQTGTKKSVDWNKVGKGFATGAATGAAAGAVAGGGVLSWATTGVGAAIGAAAGAITGLFSTKVEPVFNSLASQYKWLFNDETYELNPEILADYDKLDESTKRVVDHWDEIKDKAKSSMEEMENSFKSLSGDIGTQLRDKLVEAFKNKNLYGAIDEMHDYISQTLEDITNQMVFSAVFEDLFSDLQKQMQTSFGEAGDQDIRDDIMRFDAEYQKRLSQYEEAMNQATETLARQGYSTAETRELETNVEASRGTFQTISEETGLALEGRFTALQMYGGQLVESSRRLEETQRLVASIQDDIREIQAEALLELRGINENTQSIVKPITRMAGVVDQIKSKIDNL